MAKRKVYLTKKQAEDRLIEYKDDYFRLHNNRFVTRYAAIVKIDFEKDENGNFIIENDYRVEVGFIGKEPTFFNTKGTKYFDEKGYFINKNIDIDILNKKLTTQFEKEELVLRNIGFKFSKFEYSSLSNK